MRPRPIHPKSKHILNHHLSQASFGCEKTGYDIELLEIKMRRHWASFYHLRLQPTLVGSLSRMATNC